MGFGLISSLESDDLEISIYSRSHSRYLYVCMEFKPR